MSASVRTLVERRSALLRRSGEQRDHIARQLATAGERVAGLDGRLARASRWLNGPVLAGLAVLAVVVVARHRSLRALGAGLGALGAWRQVRRRATRFVTMGD